MKPLSPIHISPGRFHHNHLRHHLYHHNDHRRQVPTATPAPVQVSITIPTAYHTIPGASSRVCVSNNKNHGIPTNPIPIQSWFKPSRSCGLCTLNWSSSVAVIHKLKGRSPSPFDPHFHSHPSPTLPAAEVPSEILAVRRWRWRYKHRRGNISEQIGGGGGGGGRGWWWSQIYERHIPWG